ncbi:hypothetical protein [Nocardioides sp. WS12]|uniref:hypothetical protein n=1 Tax=Nocardioides sp. WS12 TaxID=2486272 RepID=UPI0015F8D575|nr:hypothetical protein [Nocardioides sp. WS12]
MRLALLALALPVLVLAGCAGNDDAGATDDVSAVTSTAQQDTATPTPTPSPTASPPRKSSPAEARSVRDDVETVAVSLESFYRGGEYPRDLAAVKATLDDAGLALSPGNRLGSYTYDADRVEFTLCVEHRGGAWASYNTAPMTIQESGATGGCP